MNRRYSSVPSFTVFEETDTTPLISLPTSPVDDTQKFFIPDWSSHTGATQEEINRAALDPFHTEVDNQLTVDVNQDLLGKSLDEQTYILKIFDPITHTNNQIKTTDDDDAKPNILLPIKLRLKLSVCSEMKSFYELVQQIRNDYQTKDTDIDELFYCKRVQRLTSQHIEQNQLPVTILIFTKQSKDPIRLPKVSLQSTVSHILYQLLELISFDYDQSILKLRSREEYLRHDDTLCDIEYVHKCINALKPLQFILTDKPQTIFDQKRKELLPFEQFCFVQYENYIQTNKQSLKLSQKRPTILPNEQIHWFIPTESRWLEDFHQNLSPLFEQIQRCFNHLFQTNISFDEQIQFIDELTSYLKTIQTLCSNIRSNLMLNQHRELKTFKNYLLKSTDNIIQIQNFKKILIDTLYVLNKYIQSYCQAFLIPYQLEITDQDNQSINIEKILIRSPIDPCPITNSLELFTIQIDSLFSLPPNIKNVRVLASLCYGNQIISRDVTRSVSCIRNKYQQGVSEIRLNERLLFNDIYLCKLLHESLILFEIYASFIDENDSSLTSEIFDGELMYLIGWCSQNLFDSNDYLITGEYYFGIIEAKYANRTGFYSLRNISDHDCSILTVSFFEKKFFWPQIQARHDRQAQNFTEINRNKQEDLCRLLDQQRLYLIDHCKIIDNNRKEDNDSHFLWSHRYFLVHKPYALSKLFQSRTVWDYPSLIDIYGLFNLTIHDRIIDEIEAFELLLPAFPDMYIRSHTYRLLISQLTIDDLMIYLPQLLQIIKFDYKFSTPLIEHLLKESIQNHQFAHKFYWYLRQALLTEDIHFYRYFYLFLSLLYVIGENLRNEFENEYLLCLKLRQIGLEIKTTKSNRMNILIDHLTILNEQFFQLNQKSYRLPCQFNFQTNQIDISSCSIFSSLTLPMKLVFLPNDPFGEKFYSIYKIGDDLRQDQIVLQLLSCMDKIWQANDWNFRLSLFNVVQTYERCGFVEMVTESETLMEIEKPLGAIKGSFGESALYDWLRLQHSNERDFQKSLENLTYSCAGYCVGTYVLGIGDRHNENIMVKKSGHLFHIDFGKYLGDTQKFGWFNRDRSPLIFTKQMLYAMSDGGTSNDAMHRFVDLCCNAFYTLRQNSSLLLLLLSHLCSSNVPNLNYDAVRYVNDRLALSLNYAESITHFTNLIVDSLNSTWVQWNGLIHKLAQTTSSAASLPIIISGPTLSFIPQTYTIHTEGKIHSAQIVNYEKRTQPSKHYLYKIQVERINSTYHYRMYGEFYEFYERLTKQFPLMGFDLKFSQQIEDKILAQRRVSEINDFLASLFRSSNEVIESDLVCTFFHLIQRDQQINDNLENSHQELIARPSQDSSPKIRVQLKYDQGTLFIMVRHATNLPSKNGNEPKPYCKCYLFPDKSKSTKRKGKFANSRNPIFNDTFTYEMDLSEIQKRVLRVSVWNNIITVGNRILGEVDIVLSQIDWSKENAYDYALATLDSSTFFSI